MKNQASHDRDRYFGGRRDVRDDVARGAIRLCFCRAKAVPRASASVFDLLLYMLYIAAIKRNSVMACLLGGCGGLSGGVPL